MNTILRFNLEGAVQSILARVVIPTVAVALAVASHAAEAGGGRKLDPHLQTFFKAKERHARALARELKLEVSPDVWSYFDAGIKGDWPEVKSWWQDLSRRSGQYTGARLDETVQTAAWQPLLEAELAYEAYSQLDTKFINAFAREVIDSIPRDAIYFGGTDYGRGLITAHCKSQADADPFFTITQNALASGPYLAYLRATYGRRLQLPTDDDSKKALDACVAEARTRSENGELKPGEQVFKDEKGNYTVSGTTAVMGINALIAKQIFDGNPKREFYIEESFPLEWMYPHLSPHGLILKIHRRPLTGLTEAMMRDDREFWRRQTARWIGGWLNQETSLQTICDFAERIYFEVSLDGFTGDPDFAMADRRYSPQGIYSRLRTAQATVYARRAKVAGTVKERQRMVREADFAYRQAFALGPWAHEAVFRYEEFLKAQNRPKDALLLLESAAKTNPGDKRLLQRAEDSRSE
jgi:hypothetical protein